MMEEQADMEWRWGGLVHQEAVDGWNAICECSNMPTLEQAIERLPVLRSPAFHAFFRQMVASILREVPDH